MSNRVWNSDRIQFPRLLAELRAIGLTAEQYAELLEAMDCDREKVDELLERAEVAWQTRKATQWQAVLAQRARKAAKGR